MTDSAICTTSRNVVEPGIGSVDSISHDAGSKMDDLEILPILLVGVGLLMVWGGLTGQNPVVRVREILTRGGTQSAPATEPATATTYSPTTYTVRRDYLA